jgi:hypothetical protein
MIETPGNATITVSSEKRARAPRNKRTLVPTAKIRENQATRRTRQATRTETPPPIRFHNIEDSDSDYEDENGDTSHTVEELLGLVKGLKKTIDQQNRSIQEALTTLKELKEEQHIVKTQNIELVGEVRKLQGQVSALSTSLRPTQSWAAVAAAPSNPQSAVLTTGNHERAPSAQMTQKEANCVRIFRQWYTCVHHVAGLCLSLKLATLKTGDGGRLAPYQPCGRWQLSHSSKELFSPWQYVCDCWP